MSQLTIPDTPAEIEYTISSPSTGPFTVPFSFFAEGDVLAKHVAADGTETDYVVITDFTFDSKVVVIDNEGVGWLGGIISFLSSVPIGTLNIYRSVTIDRLANYPTTGPISIAILNDELNKFIAIMQELKRDRDIYLSLDEGAISTQPFNAGRGITGLVELAADSGAATNRQVDANGPNWLADTEAAAAVGTYDQWNTVFTQSAIVIEGNDTTKFFDLMTQFFAMLQNRNGAEASFYMRYRYQVDCYSQVSKVFSSSYPIRIGATSAIPLSFMDIAQDIDYTNGNCTLMVAVDIFPIGSASGSLYMEGSNLAVNTSEPR